MRRVAVVALATALTLGSSTVAYAGDPFEKALKEAAKDVAKAEKDDDTKLKRGIRR